MVFDVERRETLGADQTGENILRIISQENKFDKWISHRFGRTVQFEGEIFFLGNKRQQDIAVEIK